MSSGCTSESSNPSAGCLQKISSNCVVWQGDVNSDLDVCKGDTITEVVNTLLTQVINSFNGSNITVNVDTVCDTVNTELAGKEKTLPNILQAIINVICGIVSEIESIQTNTTPMSFSLVCLTGESSLRPLENTIGILINQLCAVKTQVDTLVQSLNGQGDLNETVVNIVGDFLLDAISSCGNNGLTKTGSGINTKLTFTGMVPPYVPVPYIGPLSWFDTTGKGLSQYGMCGWYIMNGLNGTQNWLGYTFAGATVLPGINSTSLDARVASPNDQSNINDRKGEVKHVLTPDEGPKHTHDVSDLGHTHSVTGKIVNKAPGGANSIAVVDNYTDPTVAPTNATYTGVVDTAQTGIILSSAGQSNAHENRQPTVYGVWIVRLP